MKIQFAFALNNEGVFENNHFGDAEKYALYSHHSHELKLNTTFPNPFKSIVGRPEHSSREKGTAIISFLKDKGIKVLVSKKFGKNIGLANQYFIPVIINDDLPEKVIDILNKNMNWLKDELKNRKSNYMLFKINKGILKSEIK